MDENFVPVLQQLAAKEGINAASLYVEGNVVFLRRGNELVGTVCQIDTPYWNAVESASEVLARLQGR